MCSYLPAVVEASQAMETLLAGTPAGPLVVRFQTLLERDDRVGARRALEEALRLAPRAVGLMVSLAQLEEQAGEDDAAIARYRRILDVQPANVVALNNLAFALAVRHNAAAEALPLARRAVGLAPRSGTVLDTLGWVEHLLGNHDVAANLLGQAVRLEPGQAEIRLHAAIVYMASGKSDRAEMELKEALRLDPALEGRDEVRQLRQGLAAVKPVVDAMPGRAHCCQSRIPKAAVPSFSRSETLLERDDRVGARRCAHLRDRDSSAYPNTRR